MAALTTVLNPDPRPLASRHPVLHRLLPLVLAIVTSLGSAVVVGDTASAHGAGANGCTLSPDSLSFPVYYNFHDQCDRHDWCYDQLWFGWGWYNPTNGGWTGRLACDNMFHNEMRGWCGRQYSWNWAARYSCYGVAATYYTAVRNLGAPYFANPYLN